MTGGAFRALGGVALVAVASGCFSSGGGGGDSNGGGSTGTTEGSTTPGSTTTPGTAGTDTAGVGCGPAAQCLPRPPEAPAGWLGPAALAIGADGDEHIGCPGDWVPLRNTWRVTEPAFGCTCGCGPFEGDCSVDITEHATVACNAGQTTTVGPDTCTPLTMVADPHLIDVGTEQVLNPRCEPQQGPPPPALMVQPVTLCQAPTLPQTCDPGVCVANPPPEFIRTCIVAEGSAGECPLDSPYTDRLVSYGGVTDTRDCPTCACEVATGSSCAAVPLAFSSSTCLINGVPILFAVNCQPIDVGPLGVLHVELNVQNLTGSCAPTPGAAPPPIGSVASEQPLVACCLP